MISHLKTASKLFNLKATSLLRMNSITLQQFASIASSSSTSRRNNRILPQSIKPPSLLDESAQAIFAQQVLFSDSNNSNSNNQAEDNSSPAGTPNSNDSNNNNNNDDGDNKKKRTPQQPIDSSITLRTIPMKNWKDTELTEEELELPVTTHIFFSSQQPILPFSKIPCQMKTGNLKEINHELGYFILNEAGDVYQIGLELEKQVAKVLSKQFSSTASSTTKSTSETADSLSSPSSGSTSTFQMNSNSNAFSQINVDLAPKKLSSRLKIIELQVGSNGIFAKTIPYRDDKSMKKLSSKMNITAELDLIKSLYQSIRKLSAFENNTIPADTEIETMSESLTLNEIDRIIFSALGNIITLHKRYMKENVNVLIQSMIESKGVGERLVLMRISLEQLQDVLSVVKRGFKVAEDNLIRMQAQARARLSMEYIRRNYLTNDKGEQSQYGGGSGAAAGSGSPQQKSIQQYLSKLHLIEDQPSQERVKQEIERFSQIDKHSSEFNKINTYLDEVFNVPWNKFTPANWEIAYAKKVLDEEIYGLEKVKERIIQMIAVNQIKNTHSKSKGFVLLLQGPPGTGKTSIAKAIAKSLQKEARFISFAGISDSSFFKGHRRTYVDSQPGVFIKELIKAQTMNPVFILDEIDKISKSSMGGDPYYSLMEILNPEENHNFTDHYLDVKVDFSNCIFILTANNIMSMLEPLKNRLEIIEVPAYIEEEKLQISKKFIIPKAIRSNGINQNLLKFDDQTISLIIKNWCYDEAGVRSLKRCFETISRKYVVELLANSEELVRLQQESQKKANEKEQDEYNSKIRSTGSSQSQQQTQEELAQQRLQNDPNTIYVSVNPINEKEPEKSNESTTTTTVVPQKKEEYPTILSDQTVQLLSLPVLDLTQQKNQMDLLKKYLGVPIFDAEFDSRQSVVFAPGVVNILSVGGFVGHVMKIECVFDNSQSVEKKGSFSSSGNLQQVLQESLTIAKINAFNLLNEEEKALLAARNVHIHFMSGAIPKDGPSAGIAICTAYLSLATGKAVPASLAMTGELSPIGEVCKIGGLQAKIIAAKTLNINEVICPYGNLGDVDEFPQLLLQGMTIYFVQHYKQVSEIVFKRDANQITIPDGTIVLKNGVFVSNQTSQHSSEPTSTTTTASAAE